MRSGRLRYAPRANKDIFGIHDYIAQHSKNAARAVARRIRATCELLARHPGLGRETDIPGIRVFPTPRYPYLVYHRARGDELIIVHVRHGRRDVPKAEEL